MSKILDAFNKLKKTKVEPVYPVRTSNAEPSRAESPRFESAKPASPKVEPYKVETKPIDPMSFVNSQEKARKARNQRLLAVLIVFVVGLLTVVVIRLAAVTNYVSTTQDQLEAQKDQITVLIEKLNAVQGQSEAQLKRLEDQLDGASKNVGLRIAKINDNIENELAKTTSDVKRLRVEIDGIKSGNESIKDQLKQLGKKMDGFANPTINQQGL